MQFNEKAIHPEEKMASIMDKTISPSSYCVSPDPALQFVFGLFGLMTWISTVVSTTPDAMLVKGVLQVCLGIAAFAGSCMACFLPLLGDAPIYVWCEHIFVCLGLFFKSLSDILSLSILGDIGAWLLLGFALLALYQGISDMYALCGRHLPQGPRMPKGK